MKRTVKTIISLVLCLVLATMVVVIAAGCQEKESLELPNLPTLTDTRPETAEEATYTTINGDVVTYNKNTRKIVALSGAGDLVAFGIKPLAISDEAGLSDAFPTLFDGISSLQYDEGGINAEEVASYHPELILTYQLMDPEDIATLSAIAPVIPLLREETDYAKRLGQIGDIFGLEDNANALIEYTKTVKTNAAKQVEEMGLKGKTATLFMDMMGQLTIPPDMGFSFNNIIYDEFGMVMPEACKAFLEDIDTLYTPISAEKVKDFEGDVVILVTIEDEPVIPDTLKAQPGWLSLKAVQNDKVGVISALVYAEKDVLLLETQYSQLLDAFKKAL